MQQSQGLAQQGMMQQRSYMQSLQQYRTQQFQTSMGSIYGLAGTSISPYGAQY